jgi:hypothetical protein
VGITFSHLSLPYWIDYLGFITKGKLAAIFIKTFSWGFPTGRSFYFINSAPSSIKNYGYVGDVSIVNDKTLTLTLIIVDYNSSCNTYPRSDATIFAMCSSFVKTSLQRQGSRR